MTRNQRRALMRRDGLTAMRPAQSESRIPTRKIHRADIPALMVGPQTRRPNPRNTWQQRGWSDVSPYYHNMTTIDARWDK